MQTQQNPDHMDPLDKYGTYHILSLKKGLTFHS